MKEVLADSRGLTLLEVVAALAILAVVLAGIVGILGNSLDIWGAVTKKSFSHLQAQLGLAFLTRDIRNARGVAEAGEEHLKLERDSGEVVEYFCREGALVRKEQGAEAVVAEGILSFSVKKERPGLYRISVKGVSGGTVFTLESRASPRVANW
ncbi:MAG: type II secretion system protein [Firmicutes bacterium]|nr:type II secretion system protein [Bacillota bacterium]